MGEKRPPREPGVTGIDVRTGNSSRQGRPGGARKQSRRAEPCQWNTRMEDRQVARVGGRTLRPEHPQMGNVPGAYGAGIGDRSRTGAVPTWGAAELPKE